MQGGETGTWEAVGGRQGHCGLRLRPPTRSPRNVLGQNAGKAGRAPSHETPQVVAWDWGTVRSLASLSRSPDLAALALRAIQASCCAGPSPPEKPPQDGTTTALAGLREQGALSARVQPPGRRPQTHATRTHTHTGTPAGKRPLLPSHTALRWAGLAGTERLPSRALSSALWRHDWSASQPEG